STNVKIFATQPSVPSVSSVDSYSPQSETANEGMSCARSHLPEAERRAVLLFEAVEVVNRQPPALVQILDARAGLLHLEPLAVAVERVVDAQGDLVDRARLVAVLVNQLDAPPRAVQRAPHHPVVILNWLLVPAERQPHALDRE